MYPISYTMKVKLAYFLLGVLLPGISHGLIFREDQFTDMMQECLKSDGKPLLYILNANNPAMYVSVDNNNEQQQFNRKNSTNYFDCKLQFETEFTPPLWTHLVKILTRKPRHASSFFLECTDLKGIFSKITFLKSVHSKEKDEACLGFLVKIH